MAVLTRSALLSVLLSFVLASQTKQNSYIGSKACFACHSAIFRSFAQTDMGHSMTLAKDWKLESVPPNATVAQPGTHRTFFVARNESGWQQGESEGDVFSVDHQLDYVVGSGSNGLTFLIRRGSYLFQAPLSYYSRTQKWGLSPGYEHTDLGFNRVVPQECINCHAGRPSPLPTVSGAYAEPPFQELAIGCENCHGPGEAHVRANGKPLGKLADNIVNPAKLTPRLADNICLNCHQAGAARVTQPGKSYLDFRPGQWLYDTAVILKQPAKEGQQQSDLLEHYSGMQASRCFRESKGNLNCLSCHDPHVQPRKDEVANYYRNKCLTCHTGQSCRLALTVRKAQSAGDNCVGCHMPQRNLAEVSHAALTNHRILARADETVLQLPQKEEKGLVVVNAPEGRNIELSNSILLRAYQQLALKNPDYQGRYRLVLDQLSQTDLQDSYIQAALGDRALAEGKADEAVVHLTLALPLGTSAIYLELAESLLELGRGDEAIEYLKKGIDINPYDAVMQKTLILRYINSKSYAEARKLMKQYVSAFPDDSMMRGLLHRVGE